MIPFAMIVREVRRQCSTQVTFPEGNHAMETFVLDRAHEAFRVGIGIGRLKRRLDDSDARRAQDLPKCVTPTSVPITDQRSMASQHPLIGGGDRPRHLLHEEVVGMGR